MEGLGEMAMFSAPWPQNKMPDVQEGLATALRDGRQVTTGARAWRHVSPGGHNSVAVPTR
jgi:hypothetical protein